MIVLGRGLGALSGIRTRLTHVLDSIRTSMRTKVIAQGSLLRMRLQRGRAGDAHLRIRGTLSMSRGVLTRCAKLSSSALSITFTISARLPTHPSDLCYSPRSTLKLADRCTLLRRGIGTDHLRCGVTMKGGLPAITVNKNCMCRGFLPRSRHF